MKVKKIRAKKIYEQVADQIRAMIESGELKPGDKLPALKVLAEELGVSRATVREAFSSLQGMGLIDLRHGEGTFVKQVDVERITEPINAAFLLGINHMNELMEVCHLMETGIARFAAERRTDEDLNRLAADLFRLETAMDPEESSSADIRFHASLAEASRNTIFVNFMTIISEPLRSVVRLVHSETEGQKQAIQKLGLLFDCVRDRKCMEAEAVMHEYLQMIHQKWLMYREMTLGIRDLSHETDD
jgi:GntR family transcriptional regulator, transcriptional repressor for pyruvate dehydrogenase complex